jgi:hypothetical protein
MSIVRHPQSCLDNPLTIPATVAAKKQSELPITPSCLKVPGMDIDRNELKSCIAHFRTKGNGQCGTDAPLKLCELKRTVVVVTSRRAPDEVKVSCKEVVNAMQWVMDKCSDYGGKYRGSEMGDGKANEDCRLEYGRQGGRVGGACFSRPTVVSCSAEQADVFGGCRGGLRQI